MGKEETLCMLSKLSLLSPVYHLSIYYCAYMYCCQPPPEHLNHFTPLLTKVGEVLGWRHPLTTENVPCLLFK